ncbi:MAG: sctS [Chlamydiales bacterium]|jgi:type III secretion HrpO family protein|nr:sctS [Chlamydiales bacterium]
MFNTQILQLAQEALILILLLSAPPILISVFIGIAVAIFQAATQIQEQNLPFSIKLVAVIFVLIALGSTLGMQISSFAIRIFSGFPKWL